MRDLLADPACREEDLGIPLPDSPFAVSVALPLWEHVIAYEENDPGLLSQLRAGYPRFFPPRPVRELAEQVRLELGLPDRLRCALFPTGAAAHRCADYISERADGWSVEVRELPGGQGFAVVYPEQVVKLADYYWRYCGDGISGRLASAIASGSVGGGEEGAAARRQVRQRIASGTGQQEADVFLFPSGMAAVSAVHRALVARAPGCRSVQFDFPYVDVLRVQREIGGGVVFLPTADGSSLDQLRSTLASERVSAVYCEVPSNPLLRSADLVAVSEVTRAAGVPLVVDDTVATHINVDASQFADVVTTSLTKAFSGAGDVLAGAATISAASPLADELRARIGAEADTPLWDGDATALEANSRDFRTRVEQANRSALEVVGFLRGHPAVDHVYFPDIETPGAYASASKPGGGLGSLLSFVLKQPERSAPRFYDALRISKGPSLGTNFSLVCPYTLLAHYDELDWCESLGVSRYLLRMSVGLEEAGDLLGRLSDALSEA